MTICPAILRSCVVPARVGLVVLILLLASDRGIAVADSPAETCSSGIAVTNPQDNPLLVQDCNALLAARDTLSQGGRRLSGMASRLEGRRRESLNCGSVGTREAMEV